MDKNKKYKDLSELSIVFSTHPKELQNRSDLELGNDLSNKKNQKVRVQLDSKNRAGKSVTKIFGLEENENELMALCKNLKQKCGVGGNVKNREILIQGDHVNKVILILIEKGYTNTKRSGG